MADDPGDSGPLRAAAKAVSRAGKVRRLLRVPNGSVELRRIDPRATPGLAVRPARDVKAWSRAQVAELAPLLASYQERLYAQAAGGAGRQRVLLVLQAMDCGGKDGTVRSVVGALNPLGVRVAAFRAPTPAELAQDFLWRISQQLPPAGYIGVFNRSQYEDVLAVRVRGLVPARVWRARYDQINNFEAALAADGLTIVKVMLHISSGEQRRRLLARLDDPTKRWKFNPADLDDRALWPAYESAYADMLTRCNTRAAPWYVVPADRKWYRDWAVANLLLSHLAELDPAYPVARYDLAAQRDRLRHDRSGDAADHAPGGSQSSG
jgi:PPK2 family polyphosphate:nucleotide phosphotransferase